MLALGFVTTRKVDLPKSNWGMNDRFVLRLGYRRRFARGSEAPLVLMTQRSRLDAFLAEHGVSAPVTHRWAGIMGFSHDALPYVGKRSDGIYMSAGFTGHGNAFAVAAT